MIDDYYIVEAGKFTPHGFVRNIFIDIFDIKNFRERNHNKGICTTVFRYDSKDQEGSLLIGDFYLDLDAEDQIDQAHQDCITAVAYIKNVLQIPEEYIHIYFSGKKGFHITVPHRCFGAYPSSDLNNIYKMIALDIKDFTDYRSVDTQIYDIKRMFRLPGSIHQGTGLYKIPLLYSELMKMETEDIVEMAKNPRRIKYPTPMEIPAASKVLPDFEAKYKKLQESMGKQRKKDSVLKYEPPCIKLILKNGANKGQRNNTVALLASHFKDRGYSFDKTLKLVQDWNNDVCDPSLASREVQQTVKSMFLNPKRYGCTTIQQEYECPGCKLKKSTQKTFS